MVIHPRVKRWSGMNKDATKKRKLTKSERTARKDKIIAFIVLFVVSIFFVFPLIYMFGRP